MTEQLSPTTDTKSRRRRKTADAPNTQAGAVAVESDLSSSISPVNWLAQGANVTFFAAKAEAMLNFNGSMGGEIICAVPPEFHNQRAKFTFCVSPVGSPVTAGGTIHAL